MLASSLRAALVVPDTGLDPTIALLVEPSGEGYRVSLDEDATESQGAVVLASDPPMEAVPDLWFRPGRPALMS